MSNLNLNESYIRLYPTPQKTIEIYDSKVNGLAVRVFPSGTKSFVYRYRWNDQSKRYTIGQFPKISLTQARELAKDLYAKIRLGINPILEKKERIEKQKSPSFRFLKKEYIAKHLPTLRESTSIEFERIINRELTALYSLQLNQITKNKILIVLDKKAYTEQHPTQANQIKIVLSSMYSFAIKRDLIDTNLILTIPTYATGDSHSHRYYSESEILEIWNHIKLMPSPTKQAFQILFLLGQRKSETLKMKWDDIDFSNQLWIIPPYLAKNNQEHHIPIPKYAFKILNSIEQKSEYIFQSPVKENQPIQSIKRQTKKVKDDSTVKDFRVHDIRRTVATYLAKLGTDRTVIGKILNHKTLSGDNSVTAIYDRYNYEDEKRKAIQNWENWLMKIL